MTDLSQLEQFDDEFSTEKPEGFNRRPGVDALDGGDYQFKIIDAEIAQIEKTGDLVLRVGLQILSGPSNLGGVIERTYWLNDQTAINILGADLVCLGFDADQWHGDRKFSKELPLAVGKLAGVCFKGHKRENNSNGKVYHNLYVNQRIAGTTQPMPQSVFSQPAQDIPANEVPF